MSFELNPQLAADTHALPGLPGLRIRLHRNPAVCWFILVPETSETEFFDLPSIERDQLLRVAGMLSALLRQELGYRKTNLACIGNVVPQLHWHVVGRNPGDACWPLPVWGHLQSGSETWGPRLQDICDRVSRRLSDEA
jgi:diadenosine tetraphosphate (Ap4A) HIT family hydrolase